MQNLALNQYIDHTLLKATATQQDIEILCAEAIKYNFFAVCVNSSYVSLCKKLLYNTPIKIAAVIGFPLGAMMSEAKEYEAERAVADGADEIDMVIHIGMLKGGNLDYVRNEIATIKKAIGNKILKVIIETCYLTLDEKTQAIRMCVEANADFVKTSTGFGSGGATIEDVRLMKEIGGSKIKIKASGGIKDAATATQYIEEGVSRIGTSAGIEILNGEISDKVY